MHSELYTKLSKIFLAQSKNHKDGLMPYPKIRLILSNELITTGKLREQYRCIHDLFKAFNECYKDRVKSVAEPKYRLLIRQYFCYMAKIIFGDKYSLDEIACFVSDRKKYTEPQISRNIQRIKDLYSVQDRQLITIVNIFKKYSEKSLEK